METVSIMNARLQPVLASLREIGNDLPPMNISVRMSKMQRRITDHLQDVQDLSNRLIEKFGETNPETGKFHVDPDMEGWVEFLQAADELNALEFEVGEPFVLYPGVTDEGKEVYGWTPDVKKPVGISPNVLVDMHDLLVIFEEEEVDEAEVVAHIEPADEVE